MIDFTRIRRQPTAWTILTELIANALQFLLILYGLKCLLTLRGNMLISVRGAVYSSLHWVPVNGAVAATTGLLYLGSGLFLYLSDGKPPPEDRVWLWRIGRGLLRWGSLVAALFGLTHAHGKLSSGPTLASIGLSSGFLTTTATFIAGVFMLVSFLLAMYQREEVKRELEDRGCQPLHIWWRPVAYWLFRYWFGHWGATGFRVIYSDASGFIQKGYCLVYRSFLKDWQWGNRRVRWLTDTITDPVPVSEVWADSEILRSKLPSGYTFGEGDNQPADPDEPAA